MMNIEVGKFYSNQTVKYLRPILKYHGIDYIKSMSSIFKVAVGYDDYLFKAINADILPDERYIYFLIDAKRSPEHFQNVLKWFRGKEYFKADYEFDDMRTGRFHMLVICFPSSHIESYDYFVKGEYSKMLKENDIKSLGLTVQTQAVFERNSYAVKNFIDVVNKEYDSEINVAEWTGEADFPPIEINEVFNYNYVQQ